MVSSPRPLSREATSFKPQASSFVLRACIGLLVTCSLGIAAGLDTLRLRPNERIVIVAPHPDDEVIACGGLIQQALALGDSVWVVYVTSGDGSWPSAWRVTGDMFPGPKDYLELGRARIEEAEAGAKVLGLDTTHLVFLGYPDCDLAHLWQQNWNTPFRSIQTKAFADPYEKNGHEYTGRQLLNDLDSLLRTTKPARLFTPHPCDAHADHWSIAMFIAIAREAWRPSVDGPFPDVYCYLVHRPPYPEAQTDGAGFLSPPGDLSGACHHWFTTRLSDVQLQTKRTALGYHDSQRGTFGSDIYGYVTSNELFDRTENGTGAATDDAPQVGFMPEARLSSVRANVQGESLNLQVSLKAEPSSSFDYSFLAHSEEFDADSTIHGGFTAELTSGPSAGSRGLSLRTPVNRRSGHNVLLYSVEVKWGATLLNHSGIGRIVY
jgi:LmbE family N-acetylglucosaminyl deacetylase